MESAEATESIAPKRIQGGLAGISPYSQELCDRIITLLALGRSVRTAVAEVGISADSFFNWLRTRPGLSEQYARATEARANERFERIDAIMADLRSGELDSNQARVMLDAIKWQTSKEAPKRYGDKLELSGDAANPLTLRVRYSDGTDQPVIDVPAE